MGLLTKLFAPRGRRARAGFADDVLGALRLLGEERDIRFNEEEFSLDFPGTEPPERVVLRRAFDDLGFETYRALPDNERMAAAVRFAKQEKRRLDATRAPGPGPAAVAAAQAPTRVALGDQTTMLVDELRRLQQEQAPPPDGQRPKAG